MPDENASPSILPSHIDATIRAVAQLHAEHHEKATSSQRAIDGLTALLGRPWFLGLLSVAVVGWNRRESASRHASLSSGRSASLCLAR